MNFEYIGSLCNPFYFPKGTYISEGKIKIWYSYLAG